MKEATRSPAVVELMRRNLRTTIAELIEIDKQHPSTLRKEQIAAVKAELAELG
jgi:hypothetical protein